MMRIGLTQRVEVVASYGERRDCLDQAWSSLLEAIGAVPVPLVNRVASTAEYLDALALDGVILTGGNDLADLPGATNTAPERDVFEGALIERCCARGLPLFGVCRGLQHIVRRFGGALERVQGHVAAPHAITGLVASAGAFTLASRASVNSFHGYGLRPAGLGPSLRALALAPDGSVEAVAHREHPLVAIMWHPERDPHDPRDRALMAALFSGRLEGTF
jgi:putative glutamine amidotransferase